MSPARRAVRASALAIVFSALIGVSAHAQIRLPWTPVPVTGQTFAVLLTGALLGWRLGAATLVLYIAEGLIGLPVFASAAGVASAGYLLGFVAAAGLVGAMAERGWDRRPGRAAAMMICGSACIYLFGVAWLDHFVGGLRNALVEGMVCFLPGDALKAALAAALLPLGWRVLGQAPSGDRHAS